LGVFKATPDALVMLGVVSPPDGGTTLKYSPPVKVLEFPFKLGSSWKTSAAASGTYQGQVVSYGLVVGTLPYMTDTYTSVVDLSGEASTPYATFPVLRVRTVMERTVGLFPFAFPYSAATVRSFLYATECFGGVATVTAKAGERESEPTEFGEVRRLAP
jgi:hypothetical protein